MRSLITAMTLACLVGCSDYDDALEDASDSAKGADNAGAGADAAAPGQNPDGGNDGKGIIGKTTNKIVNAKEWRGKPNIVELDSNVGGGDPLSTTLNAYIDVRSKVTMDAFNYNLKIHKAAHDFKNPTYDEFMKLVKESNLELTMRRPWEMYAYDEDTGKITVLEDRAKKKEAYENAGLEYKEE